MNAQITQLMTEVKYGDDVHEFLAFADELPSKDIIVIGSKRADINPFTPIEPYDYYLARLDSNLQIEWEITLGDPNYGEYWGGAVERSSEDYIVAGTREIPPNGSFNNPELLCIDSNGNVIWQQYYNVAYNCGLSAFAKFPSDEMVLAINVQTGPFQWTPVFAKIDFSGNQLWVTNPDTLHNYRVEYISTTSDGGFITQGNISIFPYPTFVAKYDSVGSLQWIRYPYGLNDTVEYRLGGVFGKEDGTTVALYEETQLVSQDEQTFWKEYDLSGNLSAQYALPFYLNVSTGWKNNPLPRSVTGNEMIAVCTPYNNGGPWMIVFDEVRNVHATIHYAGLDSTNASTSFVYGIQLRDEGFLGVGVADTFDFYIVRFARDGRYQAGTYSTTVTANPNPSGMAIFCFNSIRNMTKTLWLTYGQQPDN